MSGHKYNVVKLKEVDIDRHKFTLSWIENIKKGKTYYHVRLQRKTISWCHDWLLDTRDEIFDHCRKNIDKYTENRGRYDDILYRDVHECDEKITDYKAIIEYVNDYFKLNP